ncbi:GGDEF domain-containing protein [Clostridia bacterium]|nr:GGDEF domain-containing protein [Clostridia bacterium]
MSDKLIGLFLRDINVDTMVSALIYCNLVAFVLNIAFRYFRAAGKTSTALKSMSFVRLGYVLSYVLVFLRGTIPDVISVHIGNSLFLFCFFVDAMQLLMSINKWNRRVRQIETAITVIFIALFNIVVIFASEYRVMVSSFAIFAIMSFPVFVYIFSKGVGHFRRGVGVFYLIMIAALLPRAYSDFSSAENNLFTNSIPQSVFYISLLMMTVASSILYLFFLKNESDYVIEGYANIDDLTGLVNRRFVTERMELIFERCRKNKKPVTALFMEIDQFREITDNFGHQFGEEALKALADALRHSVRSDDLAGRYGGEEFIVVFENRDIYFGLRAAERIMETIKNAEFPSNPEFKFTVSIGVASGVPSENATVEELVHASDARMCKVRKDGGNGTAEEMLWYY